MPGTNLTYYGLVALIALLPSGLLCLKQGERRVVPYWILLAVAVSGPTLMAWILLAGGWSVNLSTTLWVTIAATMGLFFIVALVLKEAWRLTPLVIIYMVLLGLLAFVWQQAPVPSIRADAPQVWVDLHITISVFTYAFATLAALAALSAFLQERALKSKRPTALTHKLPSVSDSDRLLVSLLGAAAAVLALGLLSGMTTLYLETGRFLVLDHKTVLSLAAFVVTVGIIVAHLKTGMRGRRAARIVLGAYLLLTLGFPGVKFVTEVLLKT